MSEVDLFVRLLITCVVTAVMAGFLFQLAVDRKKRADQQDWVVLFALGLGAVSILGMFGSVFAIIWSW